LIALIEPHYLKGEGGRSAYALMAMFRAHLMQNWSGYSDPAKGEALYDSTILRQFSGLHLDRIPDETTTLNFWRLLEKHGLAGGIQQVNGYLGDHGLMLRQGTGVMRRVRPRIKTANATPKCIRQRKETCISSG
jgi:IS5 family transposase